ncbi:hypothetical protein C8F01DRAFT_1377813 [Mycena amicta]|nr:hypothetical protein C8F01DRAFT_1377813 [Mycena amicta]
MLRLQGRPSKGRPSNLQKLGDIQYDAPLDARAVVGDQQVHVSADGRRVYSDVVNVHTKRRRLGVEELVEDDSRLTDWTPLSQGTTEDVRNLAAVVSSYDTEPDLDDLGGSAGAEKRKRYASSDDPMSVWVPHAAMFLDELLRREGLGDFTHNPHCARCSQALSPHDRIFRCTHCGDYLQCKSCLRTEHQIRLLHVIEEWNGEFWCRTNVYSASLKAEGQAGLGLTFQVGHHGFPCTNPGPSKRMVTRNILCQLLAHGWYPATTTDPETCATLEALELFRLLQVVGNVNAHDFVGTLERLTDPARVDATPDRYKAFFPGRASPRGGWFEGTECGGLAVWCWACPQPGCNLPEGWKFVARLHRYLYKLMIAVDANFRLKNRIRANERKDPALGEEEQSHSALALILTYHKTLMMLVYVGYTGVLNPIGWSTKEMGEGARHDAIEDKIDHLNFEKNVGQGKTLLHKLIIATAECKTQEEEFDEMTQNLSKETLKKWEKMIREWDRDKTCPNPYLVVGGKEAGPSERQVMEQLKAAELEDVRAGRAPLLEGGKMTAAAFRVRSVKSALSTADL